MSWTFPKRVPVAGQAISAKDMNDGLLPTVEEFGTLGESNFASSMTIVRATGLADDVAMRFKQVTTTSLPYPAMYTSATNVAYIFPSESWQLVAGLTADVITDGEALYVLGSMQYGWDANTNLKDGAFLQLAIRIDGLVNPNSVVGDLDSLQSGESMELGISGWGGGVDVDSTFPVAPGPHTVEIVGRVLVRGNVAAASRMEAQILNREMFLLEMR